MMKNQFGTGITSTKMEYSQKEAAFNDFREVKIAYLGEGMLHGEDDAIENRPYQASLICNVAGSELFIFTKVEFYRAFKNKQDSWTNAVRQAKEKE